LTNITTLLSRTAMDHNIWSMEEIRMIKVPPRWCGVSSMMPQKAIPGSQLERIRIDACNVIGETITGVVACKGEPHGDMLPIYEGYRGALRALCHAERALGNYSSMLPAIEPDKERMLYFAREGYSATPDLAVKLIRDKGYGGRRAHRVCATFVRIARERGIKPYETTGELLDEAARIADEEPPRLTTEDVREHLDPVEFIKRHNNLGDPAPEESKRMIRLRRESLAEAIKRHAQRQARLDTAAKKLAAEVAAILDNAPPQ
jgi:argininosuccinate lyase